MLGENITSSIQITQTELTTCYCGRKTNFKE